MPDNQPYPGLVVFFITPGELTQTFQPRSTQNGVAAQRVVNGDVHDVTAVEA